MTRPCINLMIGGEAGQGLNTINDILCKSLVRSGYRIVVTQDYMSRVRGGHNTFAIRVSADEIVAPVEPVDLLAALNQETIELHRQQMSESSLAIVDSSFEVPEGAFLKVPFNDLAEDKFQNVAYLGVLGHLLGLDSALMLRTVEDHFGKKSEKIAEKNEKALKGGFDWAGNNSDFAFLKLPKIGKHKKRIMLGGNQAIALGALAGGLKFYSFYPMTPATSIGVTLAAQMEKLPVVVEQAEDEIAAINMAIGASYAGAPAMTGTSGGGFALMAEGLSLAGNSETPIVIAIAQRAAPATGLPTRVEQSDLEFALHAGHGEFPRAVLAPGNAEQCFQAGYHAMHLAEKTQGPVIVLTDQFQADSIRAMDRIDLEEFDPVKPGADNKKVETPYKRYRFTESGVSPRLIPGQSEHLVVGDSHSHTEEGHMQEDAEVRTRMMDKRLRKLEILRKEVIPPDFYGEDDPDLLLICWGSTLGSAIETVDTINEDGKTAALLHFRQVWPLVPEQFMDRFESAGRVISVESNATGQFARLIRRETGFKIEYFVLRYDGRPITPEYILAELGKH